MYTVWSGYDNSFTVQLLEDGVAVDLSNVTKVAIKYLSTLYDTDTYGDNIDFTTYATTGKIVFKLGSISALPGGRDEYTELIIYAPDYTNGLVWGTIDLGVIKTF